MSIAMDPTPPGAVGRAELKLGSYPSSFIPPSERRAEIFLGPPVYKHLTPTE